jgi:cell division protein FtsB
MRLSGALLATLGVALLLAALSLVTWRQTRALEALASLDELHSEISLMTAERNELENRLRRLESRGYVVPAARERLGMYAPSSAEIVLLSAGPEHEPAGESR